MVHATSDHRDSWLPPSVMRRNLKAQSSNLGAIMVRLVAQATVQNEDHT